MKYNIALDGVILDLLQQRFPECVFFFFFERESLLSSTVCLDVIVKVRPMNKHLLYGAESCAFMTV